VRITPVLVLSLFAAVAAHGADTDGDGVVDSADNCVATQNAAQCDTDQDGYGNPCDGDFNQDFFTDASDFPIFNSDYSSGEDSGAGTDMNCVGGVDLDDYAILEPLLLEGPSPGPSGLPCAGTASCRRPNVAVIILDDIGVDMIEAYFEGAVPANTPATPNLDRLANDGVLFRNAWSSPLCAPTRATIQTGGYPHRTQVYTAAAPLPDTKTTLAGVIDESEHSFGYATAMIGKWGLGHGKPDDHPVQAGYDFFKGILGASLLSPKVGGVSGNYFTWSKSFAADCPSCPSGKETVTNKYAPEENVKDAVAWIAGRGESPWVLFLAFNSAHSPYHTPPGAEPHSCPPNPTDAAGFEAALPCYRAMIEAVDFQIGEFIEQTDPDLSSTTILVVGDNGNPLDPTHKSKGSLYEGGVHVPLIAAGYGVDGDAPTPIRRSAALVNTTDLFKTVLDLAGVSPSEELDHDSHGFVPVLRGDVDEIRHYAYAEDDDRGAKAIRNRAGYKLMVFPSSPNPRYEFYRLPNEQENLVTNAGDLIEPDLHDGAALAALTDLKLRIGDSATSATPPPAPNLAPANEDADADGIAD
jgi:arylsulfatase A-like enzyme